MAARSSSPRPTPSPSIGRRVIMPLADVMTFYMAAPLITTALSAPLLGERVEPFRWIAVGIGFVGVVIALRPTPDLFTWARSSRWAARRCSRSAKRSPARCARPTGCRSCSGSSSAAGSSARRRRPGPGRRRPASTSLLMFLVGVVSMFCFICIARALAMARAAVLAPLQYSMILWATVMGWLVWRDVPTPPILVGNAIIIGSGLFVAAARAAERRTPPARSPGSKLASVARLSSPERFVRRPASRSGARRGDAVMAELVDALA